MFTNRQDAIRAAAAIGLTLGAFGMSSAAPPGAGVPPPAANVAYMSVSYKDTWGNPTKAAVRGMAVTPAGSVAGDAEFWKSFTRSSRSIAWDPTGTWLAWFQQSDSRGTPALVIATPGKAPVTVYVFKADDLWTSNLADAVAWGRGCGGQPLVYFRSSAGALWAIDPFEAGSQPHEVHPYMGNAGGGLVVSPLGNFAVFAQKHEVSGELGIVALPLACVPVSAMPVVAGPVQWLFAARYDGDPGWTVSLDWSNDGRRLAIAMGRTAPSPTGGTWLYDPEVWVAQLNYLIANGSEQVTFESLQHAASGPGSHPSWAPTSATATCDRLAFSRGGSLMLLDVPRTGIPATDCDIPSPITLGAKSADALDWK